jgi:hypothetical protein
VRQHGSAPVIVAERDALTLAAAFGVQDTAARLGRDHRR